jgi:hypothetical protein
MKTNQEKQRILSQPTVRGQILIYYSEKKQRSETFNFSCGYDKYNSYGGHALSNVMLRGVLCGSSLIPSDMFISAGANGLELWIFGPIGSLEQFIPYERVEILWCTYLGQIGDNVEIKSAA